MNRKSAIVLFIFISISMCYAQTPQFKINNKVTATIDDNLFGQFMEKPSWEGEIGGDGAIDKKTCKVSPDVLAYLKEMHIPIIRYPGGTDVDYYQWFNLIDNVTGHHAKRPSYRNYSGKNNVTADNRLGLDAFMTLCAEIKTKPLLVVNIGDAFFKKISIEEAAKNAAGMVAYCNNKVGDKVPIGVLDWASIRAKNGHPAPYHVKYFEVGNEIQYFKNLKEKGANDSIISHYMNCLEATVNAMLAIDPTIKIITDGEVKEVSEQIRARLGNKITYLACHFYVPWNIGEVKLDTTKIAISTLTENEIWNAWVATPSIDSISGNSYFPHAGKYRHVSDNGYEMAVTEWNWNGWWEGKVVKEVALNSRFVKGIGAAGYLNAMLRDAGRMKMGCQSMLVGNVWDITAIHVDTLGREAARFFPTGKLTALYARYHGDALLETKTENMLFYNQPYKMNCIAPAKKVAMIDAVATKTKDKLYFHAINRDYNQDLTVEINLSEFRVSPKYAQHLFTTDDVKKNELGFFKEEQHTAKKAKIVTVILPKHSVSIIEFDLKKAVVPDY